MRLLLLFPQEPGSTWNDDNGRYQCQDSNASGWEFLVKRPRAKQRPYNDSAIQDNEDIHRQFSFQKLLALMLCSHAVFTDPWNSITSKGAGRRGHEGVSPK